MANDYEAEGEVLRRLAHADTSTLEYQELTRGQLTLPTEQLQRVVTEMIQRGWIDPKARRSSTYWMTEFGRREWRGRCSR